MGGEAAGSEAEGTETCLFLEEIGSGEMKLRGVKLRGLKLVVFLGQLARGSENGSFSRANWLRIETV